MTDPAIIHHVLTVISGTIAIIILGRILTPRDRQRDDDEEES